MGITQEEWMEAASESVDLETMDALIKESVDAWALVDKAKEEHSIVYKKAMDVDDKILLLLKKSGKSKYFVDDIGTMSITQRSQVTVPKDRKSKEAFFNYLKSLGEDVFYLLATVNSQSLNSWYKEQLDQHSDKGLGQCLEASISLLLSLSLLKWSRFL